MAQKAKKFEGVPRKPTPAELLVMPRSVLSLYAAPTIGRLTHLFPKYLAEHLKNEPGLTPPRVMLMWLLSRSVEPTMGEIAQLLDLTPRAITRLTDGLVEEELVERVVDKIDKRIFRIRLTSLGKKRFKLLEPQLVEYFESMFQGLDKKEIRELIRISEKLSDHMVSKMEKS